MHPSALLETRELIRRSSLSELQMLTEEFFLLLPDYEDTDELFRQVFSYN
jgi:hypothetical protein